MKTRWIGIAVALLAVLGIGGSTTGAARAQTDEVTLSYDTPEGVAFETLATG